jgi:flagellin-like protein
MLAVTFHMDGHNEDEMTKYYAVPDYGTSVAIHEDVYITKDTTSVEVTMDVLTCMNDPCDLTVPAADRFQADDPTSHRTSTGGEWSMPGQYGTSLTQTSNRRPMLEDSNWCNNRLTTLEANDTNGWDACTHFITDDTSMNYGDFVRTGQALPNVVRTIGASAVPSFAPSLLVVSLTGLFVGALTFSSRRADDEEDVVAESLEDNDMAVSPVIATILMVAITVVLSGVIYVWASSLADTDVKGVPRVTFDIDDIDGFDADNGHWRITVQSAETDLATQAVEVRVFYVDASGSAQVVTYNMADTNGIYGFNPANSDSMVTFVDQVNTEGQNKISTFNTGDTIFVRTHDSEGTPLEDATITLSYAPNVGQGALLRTWSGLSYNLNA